MQGGIRPASGETPGIKTGHERFLSRHLRINPAGPGGVAGILLYIIQLLFPAKPGKLSDER
jgi:hypothetical protein